ncbi:cell division protein FtsA [Psychromonas sp. 14N.309.X.WAT.B.A12]|uniref:cell division protein FtsA n=1 Tax=unclassified Psychromonas TaxID=2614957 RepID=UPI0025B169D6|nr:cell division protein FtsA [Psychromonas sp. 14N.309.X.WAT.B.A12]MDN2663662.1 cell division protein FtsA [Psychromonas sp. 14N.309.X.WAT.B.A12]
MESNYTVGLDIGSHKVVVLIGELLANDAINIVGVGSAPSKGVDKGSVTNLDSVVESISSALKQAEDMADCRVSSVNLSVSGSHIESINETGTWAIEAHEVTAYDVESVLHNARSVKIRDEQRLLHVIPQEYSIDSQGRINNPIGLSGVKLKANVHLITCHNDLVKNLEKAVERCGLVIDQLTSSGVASSAAILSEDEKELGVCMIDMGSGTMDLSIYIAGALQHSMVLDYAGNSVTNDIAIAFSSPPTSAEEVKVKYGCLDRTLVNSDEIIELPSVGGRAARSLQRSILVDVIEPRYSELLTLVKNEIYKLNDKFAREGLKQQLAAGVVITGGAAQIEGLVEVAEEVFGNIQVRIGKPEHIKGLADDVNSPAYSTAVGLLRHKNNEFSGEEEAEAENRFTSIFSKVKNWIKKEY